MPLVGIGTLPTPFSPASVPLPPETGGRGHTSLRVGDGGESQFQRRAYTMVLFICTYFVVYTYCNHFNITNFFREYLYAFDTSLKLCIKTHFLFDQIQKHKKRCKNIW